MAKALTKKEIKEVAALLYKTSPAVYESEQDAHDAVENYWTVKIENYITDCPGYAGDLYVLIHGIPVATVFIRDENGNLQFADC